MIRAVVGAAVCTALLTVAGCSSGAEHARPTSNVVLATTTSTRDSGLLDVLVPAFEKDNPCVVKTVAVGSGQALTMGERGDADVLLVHSPDAEVKYMAGGYGTNRKAVMHNDFVVVGPPGDPAGIADSPTAAEALSRIAAKKAPFASRADESGTNAAELALWKEAGIEPGGSWYLETGQGMGETLTIADQKEAYTISDRGTYLATKGLHDKIEFEGSADLRNNYHVIQVRHQGTNTTCAKAFSSWIRSKPVQQLISSFGVKQYGRSLFVPDALK